MRDGLRASLSVAVLVLAAGCGGSGPSGQQAPTSTTTCSPPPSARLSKPAGAGVKASGSNGGGCVFPRR